MVRYLLAAGMTLTQAAAGEAPVAVHYAGFSHGLNVLNLDASLLMAPASYRLQVGYRLTGLAGFLVHGDAVTTVDGRFIGSRPEPVEMSSAGEFRGNARAMQITWLDGMPRVIRMVPPADAERDPVPVADQAHTVDTLSAMVALMRTVTDTGRCDSAMRTFDGRRLAEIAAHTGGEEVLEPTGRSSFQGKALRCDFDGRQLGGFLRDDDQAALRKPQHGTAWFARLQPDQPMIPVRIAFSARLLGMTTLYVAPPPS